MSCELVKGGFHFYFITSVLGERGREGEREIRIGRKREEGKGGEGEVSRRKTRKKKGEIKS